ncbi:unnamed protein product [Trichobilharzia szidati]|nr:unnamed protein product [Trichobilharzia szidati]
MAFPPTGATSFYTSAMCSQSSSSPTNIPLMMNETPSAGDRVSTCDYDKKHSHLWEYEESKYHLGEKQGQQQFYPLHNTSTTTTNTAGSLQIGKLEILGKSYTTDNHQTTEYKDDNVMRTGDSFEAKSSSASSTISSYYQNHIAYSQLPPNSNILKQSNQEHISNSSVYFNPNEFGYFRQTESSEKNTLVKSTTSQPMSPPSSVSLCAQTECQVSHSLSKAEESPMEFTNYTPYLNKLFTAKMLFNNSTDQSKHQQNFPVNGDTPNYTVNTDHATDNSSYINRTTIDLNSVPSGFSGMINTTATTVEPCISSSSSSNNRLTSTDNQNYSSFIIDYEKFQPNDHKLLSEVGKKLNGLEDIIHRDSLKMPGNDASFSASVSPPSIPPSILSCENSITHSVEQNLSGKLKASQLLVNEIKNPNITVSCNNAVLSTATPSTASAYSQILASQHHRQQSYLRANPHEMLSGHHQRFLTQSNCPTGNNNNNNNNNPYPLSRDVPQQPVWRRPSHRPGHLHSHPPVYLPNGHLRSINQHGPSHMGSSHQHGFAYGLDGTRRKNATRESTTTLKVWLQEHMKNPYPTKGEKIMLAIITKMTLTQVSTWFANARRRLKKENKMIWPPKSTGSGSMEQKSPTNPNSSNESGINCTNTAKSTDEQIDSLKRIHSDDNTKGKNRNRLETDDGDGYDDRRTTSIGDDETNDDRLTDEDDNDNEDDDENGDFDEDDAEEQEGEEEGEEAIGNDISDTLYRRKEFEQNELSISHYNHLPHSSFMSHIHKDISSYEQQTRNYSNIFSNSLSSDFSENSGKYDQFRSEDLPFNHAGNQLNSHLTSSSQTFPQYVNLPNNQFAGISHIPPTTISQTPGYFNSMHDFCTVNKYFPFKTDNLTTPANTTTTTTSTTSVSNDDRTVNSQFHKSTTSMLYPTGRTHSDGGDFVMKSFNSSNSDFDVALNSSMKQRELSNSPVHYLSTLHSDCSNNANVSISQRSNFHSPPHNSTLLSDQHRQHHEHSDNYTPSTDCATFLRTKPFIDNIMLNTNYLQSNFC